MLSGNSRPSTINEKTFAELVDVLKIGLDNLGHAKGMNQNLNRLAPKDFRTLLKLLPFSYRGLLERKLGVKRSTLGNYCLRGPPNKRNMELADKIKAVFADEIDRRAGILEQALRVCKGVYTLSWDTAKKVETIDYNDYIYDFVVPEGHTFVGGAMPTLLHNTQVAHQLAINVQLPVEKGGLDGACLYIDTEATFRPERIMQMAEGLGLDPQKVMENIYVARAYNSAHQTLLAEKASDIIKPKGIRLIVVDSVTALFRSDFTGRGELAARQQKLNKHLHTLQRLADVYNIAIYVTNQVMARPDILYGDPTAPIGGHILGHFSTYRVYVRKSKGETRIGRMIDSPNLPEGECVFCIKPEGVRDPEEKEK